MKKIFEKELEKEMKWLGSAILIFTFFVILKLIN